MNERFSNQVVLVTGGTGGLGRAVSLAFIAAAAKVFVTYRVEKEFDELKQAAGTAGSSLHGTPVDVTDDAAMNDFVQTIVSSQGRLDVVVNTVGGYAGGIKLWDTDAKTFDRMLTLNLRAGYTVLRSTAPTMIKQKRGAIINVAAKAAFDHAGGAAAYAASKAAAVAMIDSLAADLMGTGVRANSILPSIIDTPANRKAMPNADFARWPKPEEIARVILFLCSEDAKLIHGAAVPVYGNG